MPPIETSSYLILTDPWERTVAADEIAVVCSLKRICALSNCTCASQPDDSSFKFTYLNLNVHISRWHQDIKIHRTLSPIWSNFPQCFSPSLEYNFINWLPACSAFRFWFWQRLRPTQEILLRKENRGDFKA